MKCPVYGALASDMGIRERQHAYNVTLRSIRINIIAVEKQQKLHIQRVCVCVCVCLSVT